MLKLRARPDKKLAYCSEVGVTSQQIRATRPSGVQPPTRIGPISRLSVSFDMPSRVLW